MNEGNNCVLIVDGQEYQAKSFRVTERVEGYFCNNVELTLDSPLEISKDTPYAAKLVVNGDALWHFPWMLIKESEPNALLATQGAIFCPLGLSQADELKYEAINLVITSNLCYSMTTEVWYNLLLVFGDWLKARGVPQYREFVDLAKEIMTK